MRWSWLALSLCACGTLPSGAGAPENAPASGLGPSTPWEDPAGLSWSPPFILADPAQALTHPSAIADGEALDLWAESTRGTTTTIVHSHASSFATGFGETDEVPIASLSWQDTLHAPSVVALEELRYLFYLSAGRVGLCEAHTNACRTTPLYVDPSGEVRSIAAARVEDEVHVAILVGNTISLLAIPTGALAGALADGEISTSAVATNLAPPAWAIDFVDLGLRADSTATGRWREDLFFACSLPQTVDLGDKLPTAIGAASRYPRNRDAFDVVPVPILGGLPAPRAPTALGYDGGMMLLYSAQSGPRPAVGVARHP